MSERGTAWGTTGERGGTPVHLLTGFDNWNAGGWRGIGRPARGPHGRGQLNCIAAAQISYTCTAKPSVLTVETLGPTGCASDAAKVSLCAPGVSARARP